MENKVVAKGGISLNVVIFIVFLVLKLANIGVVATWSWWWVTIPLWGGVALVLLIWLITFIIGITAIAIEHFWH